MEGIADFLDALLGGVDLIFYSMTVGGMFWYLIIIKPWKIRYDSNSLIINRGLNLLVYGSFVLAGVQLLDLVMKAILAAENLGAWPFPAFSKTTQFQAGIFRIASALSLALYLKLYLPGRSFSKPAWIGAYALMIPLVVVGAWLVHGAARFENRELLMVATVLHQIAAAVWIGGIFQLLRLWLLKRYNQEIADFWPVLVGRFSKLGMTSIGILLLTGVPLVWNYVGTWNGLIGTGYGNLLVVKIGLLTIALLFAYLNYSAVRRFCRGSDQTTVGKTVPFYIEAETFVLISILFTAANLSSQPPSIDIPDLTSDWSEVVNAFRPRIPRITSPTHEELLAGEAGRTAIIGQVPSRAAADWSDYNHNISGIFIFVTSLVGMLSYNRRYRWAQCWPLGFVALGVFLFFRSDAETWPLGPIGFWESTLGNGEVLQHRIATLLVFMIGVMEFRARFSNKDNSHLRFGFPVLCAVGGLMLLTHSHVGFQPKTEFLIQVGHTLMGVFSIILACGRWLELRLQPPVANIAGFISLFALFQISAVLMFYREPLV